MLVQYLIREHIVLADRSNCIILNQDPWSSVLCQAKKTCSNYSTSGKACLTFSACLKSLFSFIKRCCTFLSNRKGPKGSKYFSGAFVFQI